MSEEHNNEEFIDEEKEEIQIIEEKEPEEVPPQDIPSEDENLNDIELAGSSTEESGQMTSHEELSPEDIDNIDELLSEVDGDIDDGIIIQDSLDEDEKSADDDDDVQIVSVKELTERTIKRNTIEAALLAAQRPIGIEEISIKLEIGKVEIEKLIQDLAEDYMDRQTAIEIVQIGEGFSMQIKPEYTEKIVKFASGGLIPKAVMRTLTIIAVKQPLLKSLLVKMRGSTAYEHCKFLIDRGYVTSYKKGRSSILETTDQFADTFGLSRNVETLKRQLIEQLEITTMEEPSDEEVTDQNQGQFTPIEEVTDQNQGQITPIEEATDQNQGQITPIEDVLETPLVSKSSEEESIEESPSDEIEQLEQTEDVDTNQDSEE